MIQFSLRKVIKPDQNSRFQIPERIFDIPDSDFNTHGSSSLEFEILNLELSQARQPTNAFVFN